VTAADELLAYIRECAGQYAIDGTFSGNVVEAFARLDTGLSPGGTLQLPVSWTAAASDADILDRAAEVLQRRFRDSITQDPVTAGAAHTWIRYAANVMRQQCRDGKVALWQLSQRRKARLLSTAAAGQTWAGSARTITTGTSPWSTSPARSY
jgi:hypothetical protein